MKTVDKEMLYNAGNDGTSDEGPSAGGPPLSDDAADSSDPSSLHQELALAMTDPSDIPTPDPDLQPTPVGHVRSDLDTQLEKAVSVLASRYDANLPRSLILEFALQRTLVQVREQGDESPLVQWLDSVLPRH
jgi:hypothetical protein